jgi:DNA (cytosine-5)-methyltransferase 1
MAGIRKSIEICTCEDNMAVANCADDECYGCSYCCDQDDDQEDQNYDSSPQMEWVLVVPCRLTGEAYRTLVAAQCVARPWHLQGRYGSRTHVHEAASTMGIPILSRECLLEAAQTNSELASLLATPATGSTATTEDNDQKNERYPCHGSMQVQMVYKPYTVSKRAHEPPPLDARLHPERAPSTTTIHQTWLEQRPGTEHPLVPSTAPNNNSRINHSPAFTYAELFAGIGGFGVALQALGGQCVFASELQETCQHVYLANFPHHHNILYGDIYAVPDSALPAPPGKLDLLVGGFPCQPFSALGSQPGLQCPKGHLFLEIVRVLNVSQPAAFLLENVPGLLQMRETLSIIVEALDGAGYDVTMEVCDARGLTCTSRKRLYLVGLRRGHQSVNDQNGNTDHVPNHCEQKPFEFPFVPDLGLRARDVLQYELLIPAEEALFRITDQQLERLNREKYWRPAHLAWPNVVIDTLVSHYGTSVARGHSQLVPASAHNRTTNACGPISANPRRFTPRECARIMGFPSTYIIPPKIKEFQDDMARAKELYGMFGNAVCPPVIAALAGAVLDRCPAMAGYDRPSGDDWIVWGRTVAIHLAWDATLLGPTSVR